MNEISKEQRNQVTEALISGNKIEAIKLYREATGLGLKEAKDEIERIASELGKVHPEMLASKKSGCAALLFLAFSLLSVGGVAMRILVS